MIKVDPTNLYDSLFNYNLEVRALIFRNISLYLHWYSEIIFIHRID